jgi:hypothetical protein
MFGKIKEVLIIVDNVESSELLTNVIIPQLVNAGFTLEITSSNNSINILLYIS